jgi:hypothetical protein
MESSCALVCVPIVDGDRRAEVTVHAAGSTPPTGGYDGVQLIADP